MTYEFRCADQFAKWLVNMTRLVYCCGGASEDELKAASVDFLRTYADRLEKDIKGVVLCPLPR